MSTDEFDVDTEAVYEHTSGVKGRAEARSVDPDGKVKIRIKDQWFFMGDLKRSDGITIVPYTPGMQLDA